MLTVEYTALKALINIEGMIHKDKLTEILVAALNAHSWHLVSEMIVGKDYEKFAERTHIDPYNIILEKEYAKLIE